MTANNFSMNMHSHNHNNAVLSYVVKGKTYHARVRVSAASATYGVTSTESHSRTFRAFYPHRRALGQFTITVDCIHYQEFRRFMNWLRNYAQTLLEGAMGNQRGATLMEVRMGERRFHYYGILSQGISDQDHVGSMVFSPQLTFMTIKDFNDPGTAVLKTSQASRFLGPPHGNSDTLAFYPVTASKYVDKKLYDDPSPPPLNGQRVPSEE